MNRKISVLFLLCVVTLLHEVATAQSFSIFAKQKVVIWDIFDRNDRPLSDGIKKMIRTSIVEACTNSSDYEVYEVNIEDVKRQIKARGWRVDFVNICKMIGKKADFIIFTDIKTSESAIGAQDVTIFISSSLYRIETATEVLSDQARAEANSQSVMSVFSQMICRMLGISTTNQGNSEQNTTATPAKQRRSAQRIKSEPAEQSRPMQSVPSASTEQSVPAQSVPSAQPEQNNPVQGVSPSANVVTNESVDELYKKGNELYKQKNYEEAVFYMRRAAEQGHSGAQYKLGNCYRNGKGVPKDKDEAIKWYHKAAANGNIKAKAILGMSFRSW